MRLLSSKIHNYATVKDIKIDFTKVKNDAVIGVVGSNLDETGCSSNEAGKSLIIAEAPCWCWTGMTIRKQDDVTSVIGRWGDLTFVETSILIEEGKPPFVCRRNRTRRSHTVDIKTPDGGDFKGLKVADAQEIICEWLGFNLQDPFNDFINLICFSTSALRSWTTDSLDPGESYKIVFEFLNLGVFNEAKKFAGAEFSAADKQESVLGERCERLLVQIKGQDEELLAERVEEVSSLLVREREVVSTNQAIFDDATEIKKMFVEMVVPAKTDLDNFETRMKKNIEDLKEEKENAVAEYDSGKLDELNNERQSFISERNDSFVEQKNAQVELETFIDQSAKVINPIKVSKDQLQRELDELSGQDVSPGGSNLICPSCGTHLLYSDGDLSLVDEEAIERHQKKIEEKQKQLDNCRGELSVAEAESRGRKKLFDDLLKEKREGSDRIEESIIEINNQIIEVKQLELIVNGHDEKIITMEAKFTQGIKELTDKMHKALDAVGEAIKEHANLDFINLEELVGLQIDKYIEDAREMRDNSRNEITRLDAELAGLNDTLSNLTGLRKQLSAAEEERKTETLRKENAAYWVGMFPKIARRLVDQFLPAFAGTANKILEQFGVTERVRFKFGEGKRKTFDVEAFDGNTWRGIKSFSSGKRARIAIALGFAQRQISLAGRQGRIVDFLVVDEILDRIDQAGVDMFFGLINDMPGLKMIISHKTGGEIDSLVDAVLSVKKQAGVTYCSLGG